MRPGWSTVYVEGWQGIILGKMYLPLCKPNVADPDEVSYSVTPYLGLNCFHKYLFIKNKWHITVGLLQN